MLTKSQNWKNSSLLPPTRIRVYPAGFMQTCSHFGKIIKKLQQILEKKTHHLKNLSKLKIELNFGFRKSVDRLNMKNQPDSQMINDVVT